MTGAALAVCSVESCERARYATGYCAGHYGRVRRWGEPRADVPLRRRSDSGRRCTVAECGRPVRSKGFCAAHHGRWKRYGDPQAGRWSPASGVGEKVDRALTRRQQSLRSLYGLDLVTYDRLLADQGGACAICRRAEKARFRSGRLKPLVVDHDHATGAIRGLLCQACNQLIGLAKDERLTLERAAAYVGSAAK